MHLHKVYLEEVDLDQSLMLWSVLCIVAMT